MYYCLAVIDNTFNLDEVCYLNNQQWLYFLLSDESLYIIASVHTSAVGCYRSGYGQISCQQDSR